MRAAGTEGWLSPENKGVCFMFTQPRQVMEFGMFSIHTIPLPKLQTMCRFLPLPRYCSRGWFPAAPSPGTTTASVARPASLLQSGTALWAFFVLITLTFWESTSQMVYRLFFNLGLIVFELYFGNAV